MASPLSVVTLPMASIRASTAAAALSVGVLRRHVGLAEGRCQGNAGVMDEARRLSPRSRPPAMPSRPKDAVQAFFAVKVRGCQAGCAILARFQLRAVRQGQGPRMLPAAERSSAVRFAAAWAVCSSALPRCRSGCSRSSRLSGCLSDKPGQ